MNGCVLYFFFLVHRGAVEVSSLTKDPDNSEEKRRKKEAGREGKKMERKRKWQATSNHFSCTCCFYFRLFSSFFSCLSYANSYTSIVLCLYQNQVRLHDMVSQNCVAYCLSLTENRTLVCTISLRKRHFKI